MSDHIVELGIPDEPRMREGESYIAGRNNQLIIFERDRPGAADVGYGSDEMAGTVHLVVGRKSQDPSLVDDSSFVYISMKTDADENTALDQVDGWPPAPTGPSLIAKSDNVRVIHRNDVRITSADGKNFINMDSSRCEIRIGASWLTVQDGTITIEAGTVNVGENAKERMILGDSFMSYFNEHIHISPTGPTSKVIVPMTEQLLGKKGMVE